MNQMEGKRRRYAIISNLIFMGNLLVLSGVIGEHGVGYLAGAFECFFLFMMLTVYTMPEAMERLMRVRMQKGQAGNAMRVLNAALFLGLVYSVIGSILMGVGAEFLLEKLIGVSYAAFTLRLFIPAYVLFTFAQAFRGFFQGMGTAVPTGISGILEQLILFGAGLLFCFLFKGYGEKVSAFLVNEEFTYSFASAGVAVGFAVAELFVVLFLFFVYVTNKRHIRRGNRETFRMKERMGELAYILVMTMLPTIACVLPCRVVILGGMTLFQHQTGVPAADGIGFLGAFYGKYLALIAIVVMVQLFPLISLIGQIQNACKKEEYKYGKERLATGVHALMMQGTFLAVFLAVFSETLMGLLYKTDSKTAGLLLQVGSVLVLFVPLGIFFLQILTGLGKNRKVCLSLLTGAVAFFAAAGISMGVFHAGIKGVVIGLCICWLVILCGGGFLCMRSLKWKPEWIYLVVIPTGCAAVSGIMMLLLNKALVSLVGEGVAFLICLLVGVVANFILLLALRGIRREEMETFPGGRILCKFGEILHFL